MNALKRFLGLAVYYRRFIKDFSTIANHSSCFLKKDKEWAWTDEQSSSFDKIKEKLISAPPLVQPNYEKPFYLYTDRTGLHVHESDKMGDNGLDEPSKDVVGSGNDPLAALHWDGCCGPYFRVPEHDGDTDETRHGISMDPHPAVEVTTPGRIVRTKMRASRTLTVCMFSGVHGPSPHPCMIGDVCVRSCKMKDG